MNMGTNMIIFSSYDPENAYNASAEVKMGTTVTE